MYERIAEEAFAVEQVHFKKTKKRANPKKTAPFMVIEGKVPLLLSAPHSVRQVRDGKIRRSDENTGSLAYLLSRETGCHAVAVKKLYGGDPEWDEKCIYKERLRKLVEEGGIRLVIDLHGASRQSEFDIDLGTMHGKSLLGNTTLLPTLKRCFHAEGILKITENAFPAETQHTVTRYCCEELGVPAVQLEINHRYRAPNRNATDYSRLFRALVSAAGKLSASSL